jgi:iron complex transport system ATP-binding protein
MPELRTRIGVVEPALGGRFYPHQRLLEIVVAGATAPSPRAMWGRARSNGRVACSESSASLTSPVTSSRAARKAGVPGSCSHAASASAPLLVLDQPPSRLDAGGRELLLTASSTSPGAAPGLATVTVTVTVTVTHYVEELPATTTHLLLLWNGSVVVAGPVDEVATDAAFSDCFATPLRVERSEGRVAVRGPRRRPPRSPSP